MSSIRRSLSVLFLAGVFAVGCESTHEYFDVGEDPGAEGGDALPELTCMEVITCAADCGGDATCEDACAARVCAGSSGALDALETCQTDHCSTECADPSSTDCASCMMAACMTEYTTCSTATCG